MKINYIIICLALLASCKKTAPESLKTASDNAVLTESGFENRITYVSNELENVQKTRGVVTFSHIANVSAPIFKGDTLSATGMEVLGNYCYVTYHVAGATYGGAIEVFDISNSLKPTIVSQLLFDDTDINECTVDHGKLYAVGGRNIYTSNFTYNNTQGAILLEVGLVGNKLSKDLRWMALPSYSGNSVAAINNFLYVVSGSTGGGVYQINKQSFKIMDTDTYENARYCDVDRTGKKGSVIVLQGLDNPKLNEYSLSSNFKTSKNSFSLNNKVTPNGKSVINIDNNDVYVCTGEKFLLVYTISDLTSPYKTISSLGEGYVNGVHCDNDYVYVANGFDGLAIYDRAAFGLKTIFKYSGSSNYVHSNGKNIFISNGKGGLKILKRA